MRFDYQSLVGTEINELKISGFIRHDSGFGTRKRPYYECICVCGKTFSSRADHIKSGACKSCGCITDQLAADGHRLPNNQAAINDLYRGYVSGAKNRDLEFALSKSEFESLIFRDCFYCGTTPALRTWKVAKKGPYSLAASGVDRVDSDIGYIDGNCVPCCPQCNFAKSDLSLDDFRKWINKVMAHNIPQ